MPLNKKARHENFRKRQFCVATLNVLSICTSHDYFGRNQLESLAVFCLKHNVSALAIQEHSVLFKDTHEIKEVKCGIHSFIATSAEQDTVQGKPVGGVAWFINRAVRDKVTKILAVHPRILHLEVGGNCPMHLFCCYVPPATALDIREHLFCFLSNYIQENTSNGVVIAAGDFNSLQQCDEYHTFGQHPSTEITSAAADQFTEFLGDTELITTSGQLSFKCKPFSFRRANTGEKVLLDYVLIRRAQLEQLVTVSFPARPVVTDHWPVVATLNLAFHEPVECITRVYKSKIDLTPLTQLRENEIRTNFINHVLSALPDAPGYDDFGLIVNAFQEAATLYLPVQQKEPRKQYCDRESVKEARKNFLLHHDDSSLQELRELYNKIIGTRHEEYTKDADAICSQFMKLAGSDPYVAYQALKQITGASRTTATVQGETADERKHKIAETCRQQLTNDIGDPDLSYTPHDDVCEAQYNIQPFTLEELTTATTCLRNHKAPGPDDIYPEFLKLPSLFPKILSFLNSIYLHQTTPQQMKETAFAMIPKPGGNLGEPANWRYVALMSYMAKLYDILLRERLRPIIDQLLRFNQNGFRKGRSTQQHLLSLEFIMNAFRQQKKAAIFTFVDFKNAFPSVQWYAIAAALNSFRVPPQLITAVLSLYHGHQGFVHTTDGDTKKYSISAGVLQGDTLAPYLFVIVLNEILRQSITSTAGSVILECFTTNVHSKRYFPPVVLTDLDFADDIVLINTSSVAAESMLHALEREARRAGLVINIKKTQNVIINNIEGTVKNIDGMEIKTVPRYRYLGRWTDVEYDITVRTATARKAMQRMNRVWSSSSLTNKHKAQLFKIFILPSLLYGMSTYPLTHQLTNRIRGCTTRMLKRAYNINPLQHCTIEDLYQQGDVSIALAPVQLFKERMTLIGAGLRNPNTPLYKLFMLCHEWQSGTMNINKTIMESFPDDITPQTLIDAAQDPLKWRALTDSVAIEIHQNHLAIIKANSEMSRNYKNAATIVPQEDMHLISQDTLEHWIN